SIHLFTLPPSDPPDGIRAQSSKCADDRQGKEESEDYMGHHQQSVHSSNAETEYDLIAPSCRRCRRIGHHVKRVEDKSDTRHRYQSRAKRSTKQQTSQTGLCDKATEPRSNQRQPVSEARIQKRPR